MIMEKKKIFLDRMCLFYYYFFFRILRDGDFSAEDRKEIIRQIILCNKVYGPRNPRNGLLYRLTTTHRDAHETMVESFGEMESLLQDDTLNERWGVTVRTHMRKLQSMFDTYSREQQMVRSDIQSMVLISCSR